MNGKNLQDQTDILEQNTKLTTDLAAARGEVSTLTSANEKLTTEATALRGQVLSLTTERDALKADKDKLATENTRLTGEMASFEKRVAAEVAKHGITPGAVPPPKAPESAGGGSADLLAQYQAVSNDPKKRAEFLAKNAAAIAAL